MYQKREFPLSKTRQYLEPGPIVLVSSSWKGRSNIMTMGWHMMLAFDPALVACYIWEKNFSFEMLRRSKECVINLPTTDLLTEVVGIGNCSGEKIDKFDHFGLTRVDAKRVNAPMINECHSNFECRLHDGRQIEKYGLVQAHVSRSPNVPETLHYQGQGRFMVSGKSVSRRKMFLPQNL